VAAGSRNGRSALPTQLGAPHPTIAQWPVATAYRIRFVMQMSAREAMHLIELRISPQGHPTYRRVAHQMHALIREVAGHTAIAEAITYVDFSDVDLERLEAERRADQKRRAALQEPGS
jgi:thymidylate synthase ThyX